MVKEYVCQRQSSGLRRGGGLEKIELWRISEISLALRLGGDGWRDSTFPFILFLSFFSLFFLSNGPVGANHLTRGSFFFLLSPLFCSSCSYFSCPVFFFVPAIELALVPLLFCPLALCHFWGGSVPKQRVALCFSKTNTSRFIWKKALYAFSVIHNYTRKP